MGYKEAVALMNLVLPKDMSVNQFEFVCLCWEPIDWLQSWYSYRQRPALANQKYPINQVYTGNISFESFMEDYLILSDHGFYATKVSQFNFVEDEKREFELDKVLAIENLSSLENYLSS
jgi:hypothetical protein